MVVKHSDEQFIGTHSDETRCYWLGTTLRKIIHREVIIKGLLRELGDFGELGQA